MLSTSIDPHNHSNGRPLRIVSTNRLFTKVRTEQPSESVLPSIMDTSNLFADHHHHHHHHHHHLDVFPKDESILDETAMITPSSSSPSFVDFHPTLSSSASNLSSPTSFSPLQHDHSYGVSTNPSSLLPSPSSPDTLTSPDLTVHHSTTTATTTNSTVPSSSSTSTSNSNNPSVVVTWPQINCRALRPDDYHMLLELLSSNTNADAPPVFFGSALIDPSTPTPYSDATRTQPKKRVRPGHVKRPMNAFMVFSQIERRKMVQLAPHLPNADISKCCGAKWKRMSLRERQPYMEESERLKHLHARQYPTYKYQPRKRSKTNSSHSQSTNGGNSSAVASSSSSPSNGSSMNVTTQSVPSAPTTLPPQTSIITAKEQPQTPPPTLSQPSSSSSTTAILTAGPPSTSTTSTTTSNNHMGNSNSSNSPTSSSSSNPNDPVSLLVATLFDQKLAMFASNLQQFNIDHLQYHFTPANTQLYSTSTPIPFDPVAFLAKQQQHRLV